MQLVQKFCNGSLDTEAPTSNFIPKEEQSQEGKHRRTRGVSKPWPHNPKSGVGKTLSIRGEAERHPNVIFPSQVNCVLSATTLLEVKNRI